MLDYYEDFPRGGAHLDLNSHDILTEIKVTTWTATEQTSVMFSQSHCIGKPYQWTSSIGENESLFIAVLIGEK